MDDGTISQIGLPSRHRSSLASSRSFALSTLRVGRRADGPGCRVDGIRQPVRSWTRLMLRARPSAPASTDDECDVRRAGTVGFAAKFGAALAHEISTPLGVIAGRIALALRELPTASRAHGDLHVALAQTARVAEILRAALKPLEPPALRLSPLAPGAFLIRILASLDQVSEALGIELAVSIDPDLPRIKADFQQLARVITCILTDSLEATPSGQRVVVTARRVLEGNRRLLSLSIADSGAGLAPAQLAHVFDALFLARPSFSGVSLALAAARDILRGHGGELRVESNEGAGTTVRLELPAIEEDEGGS
ncbi:MAG: hypothetical protein C5B48_14595 [Candidatus Rokuibacteriota bacterium]|nr:MAG: hypothetical protein C5B48_14595 [Candidatus Rokubacteria bacterium]